MSLRATEGSEAISFFSSEIQDCFVASLLAMTNPDFFSTLLIGRREAAMRIKVFAIFILALMVLAACGPQTAPQVGFASANQAWIDAPLPDSHLPLAAVEIVAHAANPDGIASFEIDLNGQLLAKTVPDPASIDQTLMYTRYSWQPSAPGSYRIEVRAFDRNNQPGLPAQVTVEVGEPTPSPTATLTPTFTLTTPPAPFFKVVVKPKHIYYLRSNCGDKQVQFQVQVSDPAKTAGVWLFVRLRNKDSEETTDWSGALVMSSMGSGWYSYMLLSEDIPSVTKFRDAWVQYQFVAYDKSNTAVARSDVLWDVELSACGR
jgi:hypothetical protein